MSPAEQLLHWVKGKHDGQLIKHTGQPYFDHLLAVAEMAAETAKLGYETGLCHDLLEDTDTTVSELLDTLMRFGYTDAEARHITICVVELTSIFTAGSYPEIDKIHRKEKEAARLVNISPDAQTVKYCDLIYNIEWVLQYDQKHAERYLKKKQLLILGMLKGDKGLRKKALDIIYNAINRLGV